MVVWSPDDDDVPGAGFVGTPAEAAAKMLFGADEAPRMVSALTAGLAATEQKHAHASTPNAGQRRKSLDGDDRPRPPRLARHASFTSWDWNGSGQSSGEGCCVESNALAVGAEAEVSMAAGALGLPRRGRRANATPPLPTIRSPVAVAKRRRVSEGEMAENDHGHPTSSLPIVHPSSPIVISAEKKSPPRQCMDTASVDDDGPSHVELARERDAEEERRRRREARREGESETMQVLRRQWETMKGRTMRAGTPPPAGGARPERARDDGDGDTPPPKMVRRRAPNLKQRLSEVLIPVLNPMRNWNFNTRVTGLNLSNASIGPEGAKFLASALHGRRNADGTWVFNSVLRSLNLEFNSIGEEGAVALFEALAPRWVTDGADDASDVSGHSEFDQNEWMRSTAPAASTPTRSDGAWVCNTAMQELNLNFCDIGPSGAAALARVLAPRVGPEGGWSAHERETMVAMGFREVALGNRTFATDVAAISLIAAVRERTDSW